MLIPERNPLTTAIVQQANDLSKEINRYNTMVLITFLKDELNRDYDQIKLLRKEKQNIVFMLSKLKKEVLKECVVLDVEQMNKVF